MMKLDASKARELLSAGNALEEGEVACGQD